MAQMFVCDKGHQWHPAKSRGDAVGNCPICGSDGISLDASRAFIPGQPPTVEQGSTKPFPAEEEEQRHVATISLSEEIRVASAPAATPAVSGYAIQGELGRGGMGVVYKARHVMLNRPVALKMILAGATASLQERLRFLHEAEAVALLEHPNIVRIYDLGEHDDCPFLALEYVDGGTLSKRLASGPVSFSEAAHLVETLARAMHAAHVRHIVHRDLKPANILMTLDGVPKITDFGVAKRLDTGVEHSKPGSIMGTPSFMAPEQAAGKTDEVTFASDIWSLGAILYALLTGRPPFRGQSPVETISQVINKDPIPPRSIQPQVPRDLETICLKCLQKEPGRRYSSSEELAEELSRFLRQEPILTRPLGPFERVGRWCKRRPKEASILATIIGGLAIGLAISVGVGLHVSQENRRLTRELEEARQQLSAARGK